MATRAHKTLALAVAAAVIALTGCGSVDAHSMTVKVTYSGETAYVALVTSADPKPFERAFIKVVESSGAVATITKSAPVGALNCSKNGRIGATKKPAPPLRPFIGENLYVKVYGKSPIADGICAGMQATQPSGA